MAPNDRFASTLRTSNDSSTDSSSVVVRMWKPQPVTTRTGSPLTPWADQPEIESRRKSVKTAKKSSMTSQRGKRAVTARPSKQLIPAADDVTKEQDEGGFRYYSDIGEYMREYREVRDRMAEKHKNCTCHAGYGLKEITKVYDELGLARFLRRAQYQQFPRPKANGGSPNSGDDEKQRMMENLSPGEYARLEQFITQHAPVADETAGTRPTTTCYGKHPTPDPLNRGCLASQDFHSQRQALQRPIRLPGDVMGRSRLSSPHKPPQLGPSELLKLGAKAERLSAEDAATPRLRHHSAFNRQDATYPPFLLQQKTLCKVIELSIPLRLHSPHDPDHKPTKSPPDPKPDPVTPRGKSPVVDLAPRSGQSSVLSSVDTGDGSKCRVVNNRTVREMLSHAVRDVRPFDPAPPPKRPSPTSTLTEDKDRYKPSVRNMALPGDNPEHEFSGVSRPKTPTSCDLFTDRRKLERKAAAKADAARNRDKKSPANDPPNHKAMRGRHLAADAYVPMRHVVMLKKTDRPRLAILSKCDTVVKPRVSERTFAL